MDRLVRTYPSDRLGPELNAVDSSWPTRGRSEPPQTSFFIGSIGYVRLRVDRRGRAQRGIAYRQIEGPVRNVEQTYQSLD